MGSFNILCNLTGLPILEGDSVVVMPISRVTEFDPIEIYLTDKEKSEKLLTSAQIRCSVASYWTPFICPIFGKYDDYGAGRNPDSEYGGIKIDESDKLNQDRIKYLLKELCGYAYNTVQGDNEYHDHPFDRGHLNTLISENKFTEGWYYVSSLLDAGRLFMRDYRGRPMELGLVVFRKEACEWANMRLDTDSAWDPRWTNDIQTVDAIYEKGIKELETTMETYNKGFEHLDKLVNLGYYIANEKPAAWGMQFSESLIGSNRIFRNHFDQFDKLYKTDPEQFKQTMLPYIEAFRTIKSMEFMNILLYPNISCGQEWSFAKMKSEFLNAAEKVFTQHVKDKYGDEDDE